MPPEPVLNTFQSIGCRHVSAFDADTERDCAEHFLPDRL